MIQLAKPYQLLIRPVRIERVTPSGIVIPDTAVDHDKRLEWVVVKSRGSVLEGARILTGRRPGTVIWWEDQYYRLIDEKEDVLCEIVFEGDSE